MVDIPLTPVRAPTEKRPLLVLLEGNNDIEFLSRLSRQLAAVHTRLPNLFQLHGDGAIAMIPIGGSPASWTDRLEALGCLEFHLLDREMEPTTAARRRWAERINCREGCRALITGKRSLDNYLHPQAIEAAGGAAIEFGDDDGVGEMVARHWYEQHASTLPWEQRSRRTRARLVHRAKRWLNSVAVDQMTANLLFERDPAGEVIGWLETIDEMTRSR